MALVAENSVAPLFSVQSTSGETISLADFKGKKNVVLYFYPEDDTAGCTIEACAFRDDIQKFNDAETVILGVSLDDVDSHKRFTDKFNLNFPLLADVDRKICEAYGVGVRGHWPERVTFLIGKDGIVKKVYPRVNVNIHSNELQEALKQIV
jgi:peroxiredoxin Q/BCP